MDELPTVAHDALMQRTELYKGFIMTWSDPPVNSSQWLINIGPGDRTLLAKLGRTKVINAPILEEALENTKQFIDSL